MPVQNIAFGSYEEASHPDTLKSAFAEFISTLLFVFIGEGSVIGYAKLTNGEALSPAGLLIVAICHGFAIFVTISISFNISGGHVNPAVTFGLWVGGYITFLKGIIYCIAQLVGAAIACLLLKLVTNGEATPVHALSTGETVYGAVILEIVITFALLYTIYAAAVDPISKKNVGITAPLAVGLLVTAIILFAGPFEGGSMNPARSFGPALVSWNWKNHWVYWVGPLVGGGLGGIVYELIFLSPQSTHQHLPSEY